MGRHIKKASRRQNKKYVHANILDLRVSLKVGIVWTALRKQSMIRNLMNEFNLIWTPLLHHATCIKYV
jgi:hypothetical protein